MIIDILGCAHGSYRQFLQGGDLLIVTGDLTKSDKEEEYDDFIGWIDLYENSYKKIIVIAGNHDNFLEENPDYIKSHQYKNIEYLCDSGTTYNDLKIFGSPYSLSFPGMNPHCKAFTCDTEEEIAKKWALIPADIDILITHTPPYGILDGIPIEDGSLFHVGSKSLLTWLSDVGKPRLHCFSHIHENGNKQLIYKREGYGDENNTICVNASIMNEKYRPINAITRVEL